MPSCRDNLAGGPGVRSYPDERTLVLYMQNETNPCYSKKEVRVCACGLATTKEYRVDELFVCLPPDLTPSNPSPHSAFIKPIHDEFQSPKYFDYTRKISITVAMKDDFNEDDISCLRE